MGANRAHFMRGRREASTRVIEWLDPDTGLRRKDPFDALPEVNQWWVDVLREGRLLRIDDVEDLAEEAPLVLEDLRRDGVRSVLHVPLPPHRGCWGFVSIIAAHENVTFYDEAAPLLRLAGEAFLTALSAGTMPPPCSRRAASSSTATRSWSDRTRSWSGSPTPPPTT